MPTEGNASAAARSSDLVDRALAGELDRAAERVARPRLAPSRRSSSSEKWVSTTRRAPAPAAVLARLARASGGRASPVRSGRGSVASISSRSVSARELDQLVVGAAVGAVGEPAAAARELDRERPGEVRAPRRSERVNGPSCELVGTVVLATGETRARSGPRRPSAPTSGGTSRRAPVGAIQPRVAPGGSVPGQPPTATGCWRGA